MFSWTLLWPFFLFTRPFFLLERNFFMLFYWLFKELFMLQARRAFFSLSHSTTHFASSFLLFFIIFASTSSFFFHPQELDFRLKAFSNHFFGNFFHLSLHTHSTTESYELLRGEEGEEEEAFNLHLLCRGFETEALAFESKVAHF